MASYLICKGYLDAFFRYNLVSYLLIKTDILLASTLRKLVCLCSRKILNILTTLLLLSDSNLLTNPAKTIYLSLDL